jgi:hypothetical protein
MHVTKLTRSTPDSDSGMMSNGKRAERGPGGQCCAAMVRRRDQSGHGASKH